MYTEHEADDEDETEEQVKDYLQQNFHRITPYPTADNNRLNVDHNFLTFEITNDQIKNVIKTIKNTCPGNSGINKIILQHVPEEAITRLRHIFNASLCGIFPRQI